MNPLKTAVILLVEDNPADQHATERALKKSKLRNTLVIVEDGHDALDYLYRRGKYGDAGLAPRPDLVLLDLNLPKIDGIEVLRQVKGDPDLRAIPVVVLTTSSREEDVIRSYGLGVNSFISKPVGMEGFMQAIADLEHYWLELVVLPPNDKARS